MRVEVSRDCSGCRELVLMDRRKNTQAIVTYGRDGRFRTLEGRQFARLGDVSVAAWICRPITVGREELVPSIAGFDPAACRCAVGIKIKGSWGNRDGASVLRHCF